MLKHARIALIAAIALSFTTTAVIAADSAPTPEPTFEYGPLSFNSPDGDFYVAQDGRFAPIREAEDGVLSESHPAPRFAGSIPARRGKPALPAVDEFAVRRSRRSGDALPSRDDSPRA